ncbi:hypothetical protein D3C81_1760580 [compost metagenome]
MHHKAGNERRSRQCPGHEEHIDEDMNQLRHIDRLPVHRLGEQDRLIPDIQQHGREVRNQRGHDQEHHNSEYDTHLKNIIISGQNDDWNQHQPHQPIYPKRPYKGVAFRPILIAKAGIPLLQAIPARYNRRDPSPIHNQLNLQDGSHHGIVDTRLLEGPPE